jgi:AcrR family transcriptional regulator
MRVSAATKEETRQRIIAAAVEHFKTQGFEAATTRDIARAAKLGIGTLFNYFPTKEAIVEHLVSEACAQGEEAFAAAAARDGKASDRGQPALEEDLFAHVAAILRKLKPHRKYLPAVLETSLSPLAGPPDRGQPSPRIRHLETVAQIIAQHGCDEGLSPIALQLYWTLYTGVLAYWSQDASPRQEDTLALLDQSLAMFVGWLKPPTRSGSEGQAAPELSASIPSRNGG